MPELSKDQVLGFVLAGGLARRMGGGDKGLKRLRGLKGLEEVTILDHLLERARPQVAELALNANGDPARFEALGLPVVPDSLSGNPGPLAGVLAGLDWVAGNRPEIRAIVTLPCDGPFVPTDLVNAFLVAVQERDHALAVASSRGRTNPVTALWPVELRHDLRKALVDEELRKVDLWTARYGVVEVPFPDQVVAGQSFDPFFNANKPEDLDLLS